jgi:hypothetical protein
MRPEVQGYVPRVGGQAMAPGDIWPEVMRRRGALIDCQNVEAQLCTHGFVIMDSGCR